MALVADLDAHVRRIISIHFHPATGAPFWLECQERLRINAVEEIHSFDDLACLGSMPEDQLARRPVLDFVPLSERPRLSGAIVSETGGTTGQPKRTIFSREEFDGAFVEPFVRMAVHAGFPRDAAWLFVGPGGPHIIGRAAAACAAALGGHQPFTIDFDPRWFRKLPPESMGRQRYLQHLLDQSMDVLRSEPIEVLFTTPVLLQNLARIMNDTQRERIRGVHYGGMRVDPDVLRQAQEDWFPSATHIAGYGNSLFGVCMEPGGGAARSLRYYPHGLRHQVRIAGDGRVVMHRLDPTILIVNLAERDRGRVVSPPRGLADLGFGEGVEDPRPLDEALNPQHPGIY